MEFVVKAKTHNLVIGDLKYPFRSPKQYEIEELTNKMELAKDTGKLGTVYSVWYEFFEKLGLKTEILRELDQDTFNQFTNAVMYPKND